MIYVTTEATARGFGRDGELWCNPGQGMPDTGPLPGPPTRETVTIHVDDQEYAPVPGILEAREAVAKLYNDLYRKDKASKYTAENVAICGGGRIGLTRVVAALGQITLGISYQTIPRTKSYSTSFAALTPSQLFLSRVSDTVFPPTH